MDVELYCQKNHLPFAAWAKLFSSIDINTVDDVETIHPKIVQVCVLWVSLTLILTFNPNPNPDDRPSSNSNLNPNLNLNLNLNLNPNSNTSPNLNPNWNLNPYLTVFLVG